MAMKKISPNEMKFTKGKKEVLSVRLPEMLIRQLGREAEKSNWSKSELVQRILDQYYRDTAPKSKK